MKSYYYQRCYKVIHLEMAKLELTQRCNSRCKTCSTWRIQDTTTLSKRGEMNDELVYEDYERMIGELKTLGCKYVELHGGEPTLFKELPAVARKCFNSGIPTMITTNGLSMTGDIARRLIDSGISRINYSLDGPRECHNFLRGREDAFDKLMAAMRMIREADQKKRVLKTIITMVSSRNINRIEEVLEIAAENGIDMVIYAHPGIIDEEIVKKVNEIFGEAVGSYRIVCPERFLITNLSLIDEKRNIIKRDARKLGIRVDRTNFFTLPPGEISKGIKRQAKPCWNIYTNIVVDAGGNVFPCELLRFHLGNVKESSLIEILQSELFERFTKIYSQNIENMEICNYCVEAVY
ncbi:radical SAM protein [Acidobacteriota bacterium]